jgi:alkylhydroperoxidase family enzyme
MRMEPPPGGSTMFEYDDVLNAVFLDFYGTLWSEGKLDQPTKEVERIRSARAVGCETCRNLRFAGAQEQGLTEADIALVHDGYADTALSARWKAALDWSDAVTGSPRDDAPGRRAQAMQEFAGPEFAELTLQAGLAIAFAKAMVAWGPQPELPVTVIPTPTPGWSTPWEVGFADDEHENPVVVF